MSERKRWHYGPVSWAYGLIDPRDGLTRYVGTALIPARRLGQHVRAARQGEPEQPSPWIRELLSEGFQPLMQLLGPDDAAAPLGTERQLIARHRAQLVNRRSYQHRSPQRRERPNAPASPSAEQLAAIQAAILERLEAIPDPLEQARAARGLAADADALARESAREAAGAYFWPEIGEALGMSGQGAHAWAHRRSRGTASAARKGER